MKVQRFEDEQEWMLARRGKITGSRLKDVLVKRGGEKKIGFYELIAERLGIPADDEGAMNRGHRLEGEALDVFAKESGKAVDPSLVIWMRDENESIAISPDGTIGETEAAEVKCLSSARHIEALLTMKAPKEYEYQVLQYFIVNPKLETLYFIFYDPRLLAKPFFYLTINRADLQDAVNETLETERQTIAEVEKIVNRLSNF